MLSCVSLAHKLPLSLTFQQTQTPRSLSCIFVWYAPPQKGYFCLDYSTGKLYTDRHVVLNENHFPSLTPQSEVLYQYYSLFDLSHLLFPVLCKDSNFVSPSRINRDLNEPCVPYNPSLSPTCFPFPVDSNLSPKQNPSVSPLSHTPLSHNALPVSFFESPAHVSLFPDVSSSSTLPNVPSDSIVFHPFTLDSTGSYIPIELIVDLLVEPLSSLPSSHPMQTRSKFGIHKPKSYI